VAACTKYCLDVVPELRERTSQGTCAIVHDSWTTNSEEILSARPDLVIASVPYGAGVVEQIMQSGVPFLGLVTRCLEHVYQDILHIARLVGSEEPRAETRGRQLVATMQDAIEAVRRQTAGLPKPLVYCEEWGKPLIASEPWVAELVEAAGGRFLGTPGARTAEDVVAAADPEVIIAAWCGAGNRVPLEKIVARPGWEQTKAVRDGRVYCVNDEFLNTPASTLLQGLHALAEAIHPEVFAPKSGLRSLASATPTRN
jgi:iron complex transport system substrate-binding protein